MELTIDPLRLQERLRDMREVGAIDWRRLPNDFQGDPRCRMIMQFGNNIIKVYLEVDGIEVASDYFRKEALK